jgi:sialidase-1
MPGSMTRRAWVAAAGAIPSAVAAAKPKIWTATSDPQYYAGWPTMARRASGELLLVWSGAREGHVCPFGRVELMRSHDDGATWTWPETLMDSPIDDRDAGVAETASGALLVTTFTSLAYEPLLAKAVDWPAGKLRRWQAAHARASAQQRKALLGCWMLRSADGGMTWSAPFRVPLNSPHGPFPVRGGRLLYPGKQLWEGGRNGVAESTDDGRTWKWLSEIPTRAGDRFEDYHELHGVEAADGRIIVHIRNHNRANERETLQCESSDGGKTWSQPGPIGVWGLPSHLLRLRGGGLLMTYGHRRKPYGNQARVSRDHGKTWSEPLVVSDDGIGGDLGYPSTVELSSGDLLTAWYERTEASPMAVLRVARWSL